MEERGLDGCLDGRFLIINIVLLDRNFLDSTIQKDESTFRHDLETKYVERYEVEVNFGISDKLSSEHSSIVDYLAGRSSQYIEHSQVQNTKYSPPTSLLGRSEK